mgnify:CR=1 FL=1
MELRKDYILDRYVIISSSRGKRPHQFKKDRKDKDDLGCFFCPGHESETPEEIGRVGDPWSIRWFPNKFAAVEPKGKPEIKTDNTFYTFSDAYGYHEVIVETNDHSKQLYDLSEEEINQILRVYSKRISELSKDSNIRYVNVFKNHGKEAGTSIVHSHSQVIATNNIPSSIRKKLHAIKNFETCPYCSIINTEKESLRRCFENDEFVAFCPYASRFNYELHIFPKKHITNISELDDKGFSCLASIMKLVLEKLKELGASFNYYLQYSPPEEDLHFHIEVIPRLATWAGFEYCSETIINSVSPEKAAKFYRGEG